jgi:hypothetical protein
MDISPLFLVDSKGAEQVQEMVKEMRAMLEIFQKGLAEIKEAMPFEKKLYTVEEAAIYLAVSESYLRKDCCEGPRKGRTPGPTPVKILTEDGKTSMVFYTKEDMDRWIEEHRKPRARL